MPEDSAPVPTNSPVDDSFPVVSASPQPLASASVARPVAVVGSLNMDLVAQVVTHPQVGETLLATGYSEVPGGKGLNQSISAARVHPTALVGAVGQDSFGTDLTEYARERHVDISYLQRLSQPSGRALITVDQAGDNSIIVVAAANRALTPADAVAALEQLRPSVILLQLEIDLAVVAETVAWAKANDVRIVLNPSPVQKLSEEILAACDPLIVNEPEAEAYLGQPAADLASAAEALTEIVKSVVLTAGGAGAFVATKDESGQVVTTQVTAPKVEVADTTGAGDEFAGHLVARLAQGQDLVSATQAAVVRASELVATPRSER